ncbi:exodeoxyribonuclease III [Alphaproteobacteria bacterium]|nr:exodeoxyribonuclease III [Alphaproteobacteria bacterium]
MTKIATWNVNSIRVRMPRLLEWLDEAKPDVVLLQEIKVVDELFPGEDIESLGYNFAVHGQKTYNGVAILSKHPIENVHTGLPGDDRDQQARYIEAFTGSVRVASIYLPNGNPAPGDKYDYKLQWMERLYDHAARLLGNDEAFVLGGDYNVCPTDADVYNPKNWVDDALCLPRTRNKFRAIENLGLTNAFRAIHPDPGPYSYWDYTGGAWQKDFGLLIDHILLSPRASDRLIDSGIDRSPRGREKPSDHTPVWCELSDEEF